MSLPPGSDKPEQVCAPFTPEQDWTPEQAEEFRAEWDRLVASGEARRPHLLPLDDPASRAQVRALLRECVTVVAPGETLVIRTTDLTPSQIEAYQEYADLYTARLDHPFRVLIVHGDELAVATPEIADPFADKAAQRGG